jgi:hypothetical protein
MHVITVVTKKWLLKICSAHHRGLVETLKSPPHIIQSFLPGIDLTLSNPISPKKECRKHTQEAIDASLLEGLPVGATLSGELPLTYLPFYSLLSSIPYSLFSYS